MAHVDRNSKIVTDQFASYRGIGRAFTKGHEAVNHSLYYVNPRTLEHTNTAESFFATFKRGYYGIYHSMSKQHLDRYCNEFAFRWNHRKVSDGERMIAAIEGVQGKRLLYKNPISSKSKN